MIMSDGSEAGKGHPDDRNAYDCVTGVGELEKGH